MSFQELFMQQSGESLEATLPVFTELEIDFMTGEPVAVRPTTSIVSFSVSNSWNLIKLKNNGTSSPVLQLEQTTQTAKKEPKLDLTQRDSFGTGGYLKFTTGAEALKVWIWRALKTELNKYLIHSEDYGNELHKEIGHVYNRSIKEQLLYDEIRKTLLVNPYIKNVSNFETTASDETYMQINISFECETVYGNIQLKR